MLPQYLDDGAEGWLRAPLWPAAHANTTWVRFIAQFPKDNAWALVGVTPFIAPELTHLVSDDAWFMVNDGTPNPIASPVTTTGQSVGFLLREPFWPHRDELWSLSVLSCSTRQAMHRAHGLAIAYARGEMNKDTYQRVLQQDPAAHGLLPGRHDEEFLRYLALRYPEGTPPVDGPRTRDECVRAEKASAQVLESMAP